MCKYGALCWSIQFIAILQQLALAVQQDVSCKVVQKLSASAMLGTVQWLVVQQQQQQQQQHHQHHLIYTHTHTTINHVLSLKNNFQL